jgi:hypothetical protein
LKGFGVEEERLLSVSVELWPETIEDGLKAQVPTVQVSVIDPVKPLAAEAVTVKVVEVLPMKVLPTGVEEESENKAAPVPESAAVCGLPTAVSLTLRLPESAPLPVGVKVTLTEQLWPTLRTFPSARHVFVCWKSPVTLMDVMSTVAVPVFEIVTVWGGLILPTDWFPKVKLVGARVIAEDWVTPDPLSGIV